MGWPVDHMSMASSARKRDRGATFVEYALVVAVFTTVLVGAFDVLTRSAGDELASTGDSIGTPYIGTSAGATSTSVPAGPGGSPTTPTPATTTTDRKSGGAGKRVTGRVVPGGCRYIKNKRQSQY